jgi:hypothetical protein
MNTLGDYLRRKVRFRILQAVPELLYCQLKVWCGSRPRHIKSDFVKIAPRAAQRARQREIWVLRRETASNLMADGIVRDVETQVCALGYEDRRGIQAYRIWDIPLLALTLCIVFV